MSEKPKKSAVRCKNCGNVTHMDDNTTGPREQLGWCRPCWKTAMKLYGGIPHGDMGFIAGGKRAVYDPPRELYRKQPFDARAPRE